MSFVLKNALITIVLIVAIEFVASLFIDGSRYNQIYGVLHSSSEYLWRVKGNLDQDFFGAPLKTDKLGFRANPSIGQECKKRVGIFGASPSFGWGVKENETYAYRLSEKMAEKGVCFLNYSVIGFSSSQGRKLFRKLIEEENLDSVIVTYLVNDVDFNRFYYTSEQTDSEVLLSSSVASLEFLTQKLRDTHSYKWLRQWVVDENNRGLIEQSIVKTITYKRVKLPEFLENIESMLKLSQEKGVDFYYLEMPVGIHVMAQYLKDQCETPKEIEENLELAAKKIEECKLDEHAELFKRKSSSGLDQVRSIIAMNRFKLYRRSLRKKVDNLKLIKIRDLVLGDLKENFLSRNQDYVHPSSSGHKLIAEEIYSFMKRMD